MKPTFTERQIYIVINNWYRKDTIFKQVAKQRVQSHLASGLDIDFDFVFNMVRIKNEGWYKVEA
jgi:hypothetical protein